VDCSGSGASHVGGMLACPKDLWARRGPPCRACETRGDARVWSCGPGGTGRMRGSARTCPVGPGGHTGPPLQNENGRTHRSAATGDGAGGRAGRPVRKAGRAGRTAGGRTSGSFAAVGMTPFGARWIFWTGRRDAHVTGEHFNRALVILNTLPRVGATLMCIPPGQGAGLFVGRLASVHARLIQNRYWGGACWTLIQWGVVNSSMAQWPL
jgi:hypothetical protein